MGRRESTHKICLRHGQVTGIYVLIVDGILQTVGYIPVTQRSDIIRFGFQGRNAMILIDGSKSLFSYNHTFVLDTETFPELREQVDPLLYEKFPKVIMGVNVTMVGTPIIYINE